MWRKELYAVHIAKVSQPCGSHFLPWISLLQRLLVVLTHILPADVR